MAAQKTIAVVVVAAGTGERVGGGPKQYRMLVGKPVLARTIEAFARRPDVTWVQVVLHRDHAAQFAALGLISPKILPPVAGASTRQGSVLAGLEALAPRNPDLVLIQDAARPLVDDAVIDGVVAALGQAALPVVPVTDTIKRSTDGRFAHGTENRRELFAAQTPQGFAFDVILEAHRRAASGPEEFTDDAAIAEWAGVPVALTAGSPRNIKLTHAEDFERAERLLGGGVMETRVGTGFDVHSFEPGDAVWLGGVRIPHNAGLKGHSDADAALHALTDALLGAAGLADIGALFPSDDERYRGADSLVLLAEAHAHVRRAGFALVNADCVVIGQEPRIAPYREEMRRRLAQALGVDHELVNVRATTTDRLGFTGRGEGLAAQAVALLEVRA